MMCLPDGWVTDLLSRGAAIRVIGNGVVPPAAAHALRFLIDQRSCPDIGRKRISQPAPAGSGAGAPTREAS